ncbi:hypothetical protein PMZ80_004567 [Knufia obscura]|uniref:Uncharacterized protein n=2 Tax=Knufia TaxID=430999 RepID=A0AAN8ET01_9EURO|nr:hypothetical protein PMZ80_004567 [Knufia obscura]KAK5951553.1 hypothetical protein OHC33_007231 [Knufia fluminis]
MHRTLETAGCILFKFLSDISWKHNLAPRGAEFAYFIRIQLHNKLPETAATQPLNTAFPLGQAVSTDRWTRQEDAALKKRWHEKDLGSIPKDQFMPLELELHPEVSLDLPLLWLREQAKFAMRLK